MDYFNVEALRLSIASQKKAMTGLFNCGVDNL